MSRRIISVSLHAQGGTPTDTYFDRVLKYIPGDVNAAWVAVTGLIKAAQGVPVATVQWVMFAVFIVLTAVWTWVQTGRSKVQTVIASIAFVIWVFALGGDWIKQVLPWYNDLYGSLLLIVYTLAAGIKVPKDQGPVSKS